MSEIDNGGYVNASERPHSMGGWQGYVPGINRRDLGAIEMAAALVPLYADSTWPPEKVAEEIAKAAYLISDALIKEGKK